MLMEHIRTKPCTVTGRVSVWVRLSNSYRACFTEGLIIEQLRGVFQPGFDYRTVTERVSARFDYTHCTIHVSYHKIPEHVNLFGSSISQRTISPNTNLKTSGH